MRLVLVILGLCACAHSQQRRVGKFTEVYAWKQMTYNINGNILTEDWATADGLRTRNKRQYYNGNMNDQDSAVYFNDAPDEDRDWNKRPDDMNSQPSNPNFSNTNRNLTTDASTKLDEKSDNFFIQYNNVPMGAERVGDRLFVALPRRRYGIPATLNYIDLSDTSRSPPLKPYPSLQGSRGLVSVYRTRADSCGRLWAVDTGLLELPENPRQIQQPAIVVFDLRTDRQILRYELKQSDVPANNTPTGLASITVDTSNGCADAFAYIPDLTTFGIVVYSLRDNDSWRVTHSYLHFNPSAVNLNIAGHRFQWSDGIFSIALAPGSGCRAAYFHPLISTQEFQVSTCTLNNRTASTDPDYWTRYEIVGERGSNSQSTMHDMHTSGVILFADIGADAVACWNSRRPLDPKTFHVLASDAVLMSYPADLHVTGDEVWVIANTLPRFGYSRLDPNEYNFYIYKANVRELIAGTVCAGSSSLPEITRRQDSTQSPPSNGQYRPPPNNNYQSSTYNRYNK